jgi:hypothetical protein
MNDVKYRMIKLLSNCYLIDYYKSATLYSSEY